MKLQAKDVACGWNKEEPIQRYVNFTVESGEICCILGPNGCGKTTLLKTMMGLIPRLGGMATVDGKDVASMSPRERASAMAYVSQAHTPPFTYRVRDVVMLGRTSRIGMGQPGARDALTADQALADMGVLDLAERKYTDISGGELQLVMIARALVQQPQLLVLDEPTAALDYGNAMRVIGKVFDLAEEGYGVLMTTHSPDHAFMLDSNVVLLQRDRPMQFGRAVDVITERNMRDAYGVDVETKEFLTRDGGVVRMCAPLFSRVHGSASRVRKGAAESVEDAKAAEAAKGEAPEGSPAEEAAAEAEEPAGEVGAGEAEGEPDEGEGAGRAEDGGEEGDAGRGKRGRRGKFGRRTS